MSETESTGNGRTRRWLGILLTLSLAINLLIAGAVAGALWMRSGHDGPGHPRSGMVGGPLTRALEPEARREIGRALRAMRAEAGGSRAARVASMDRILEELTRVPFEPEALDAALSAHRGAFQRDVAAGQRLLVAHLAGMTDAERAEFAERVARHRHRKRH